MKIKVFMSTAFMALAIYLAVAAAQGAAAMPGDSRANARDASTPAAATPAPAAQDDPMRLEGEKRFRANCGRCHTAPPKFPSRMMATIIRHMRVRATITDDDMHFILHYMTR